MIPFKTQSKWNIQKVVGRAAFGDKFLKDINKHVTRKVRCDNSGFGSGTDAGVTFLNGNYEVSVLCVFVHFYMCVVAMWYCQINL